MLPPGVVAVSSLISVVASTIGLAVLRLTRPSDVGLYDFGNVYVSRAVGVFGALLLYIGLALGAVPWLVGAWNDVEGKASIMLQQMLVITSLVAERFLLHLPAHPLIASGCVLVWFGSTLIEWAGPRPYDSMLTGLEGQIAGCDGGYRTPFLIYAPLWLTVIVFGALFLCFNTDARCDDDDDEDSEDNSSIFASTGSLAIPRSLALERARALRRKLLPIIYGFAMSMSGIVFASGTARDSMNWVIFGALLLALSVVCAWECLWSLDMTLGLWAMLSQNTYTLLRLVQGHLVFRDFRWNANSEIGYFIMWKWPGVWFFLMGFFLIIVVAVMFLATSDEDELVESSGTIVRKNQSGSLFVIDSADEGYRSDGTHKSSRLRDSTTVLIVGLQWILFVACIITFYLGITRTILDFQYALPGVQWVQGNATVAQNGAAEDAGPHWRTASGQSYLQLITTLYDKRLPCSAMVIAFNSICRAPLQFGTFLAVMFRPWFVPLRTLQNLQTYFLVDQASGWFVNVFVLVLMAAFFNLTGPSGTLGFITYLDDGFWWFFTFTIFSLFISMTFQLFPETGAFRGVPLIESTLAQELDSGQESASDDGSDKEGPRGTTRLMAIVGFGTVAVIVLISLALGLTNPFLEFDYRISGVVIKRTAPTLYEVLKASMYWSLKLLAVSTLVGTLFLWLPFFMLAAWDMLPECYPRVFERLLRPWVMVEHWAVSVLCIYYMVTARNKAPIEVCAHVPEDMTGIIAICLLFLSGKAIIGMAKNTISATVMSSKPSPELPCGNAVWAGGVGAFFVAVILALYFHGPVVEPEISSLKDLNHVISASVPTINMRIQEKLFHSVGSCDELWEHFVSDGKAAVTDAKARSEFLSGCRGRRPIAKVKREGLNAQALWATGINTVQLMNIQAHPPVNTSNDTQTWRMTLDGKFTDVHVWLKVDLGDKPWVNDYMCCHNPFHFSIMASANCTAGIGFHGVELYVTHIDPIELQHKVVTLNQPGAHSSYQVNYGGYDAIEESLRNFMTLKNGRLLITSADGTETNALDGVGEFLQEVFVLNTNRHCPRSY